MGGVDIAAFLQNGQRLGEAGVRLDRQRDKVDEDTNCQQSYANSEHSKEGHGCSRKGGQNGSRYEKHAGNPISDSGKLGKALTQRQQALAARILKRMRNFVRRDRNGGQRAAVMVRGQQPHRLGIRIVVVAAVRRFNFDVQVLRPCPADPDGRSRAGLW